MFAVFVRQEDHEEWSYMMTCTLRGLAEAQRSYLVRSGTVREARVAEFEASRIPNTLPGSYFMHIELAEELQAELDDICRPPDDNSGEYLSLHTQSVIPHTQSVCSEEVPVVAGCDTFSDAAQREFERIIRTL